MTTNKMFSVLDTTLTMASGVEASSQTVTTHRSTTDIDALLPTQDPISIEAICYQDDDSGSWRSILLTAVYKHEKILSYSLLPSSMFPEGSDGGVADEEVPTSIHRFINQARVIARLLHYIPGANKPADNTVEVVFSNDQHEFVEVSEDANYPDSVLLSIWPQKGVREMVAELREPFKDLIVRNYDDGFSVAL